MIDRAWAAATSGPLSRLHASERGRKTLGMASLALWIVAIVATEAALLVNGRPLNLAVLVVLLLLCAVSHLQMGMLRRSSSWNWREATMLLYSSRYLSEIRGIAGRDAFVAAVASVASNSPDPRDESSLAVVSIPGLADLRSRLGDLGGRKAVEAVACFLKRVTRGDDLIGYLGDGRFGVVLRHCSAEEREEYLGRIPICVDVSVGDIHESVGVSTGACGLDVGYAYLAEGGNGPVVERYQNRPVRTDDPATAW